MTRLLLLRGFGWACLDQVRAWSAGPSTSSPATTRGPAASPRGWPESTVPEAAQVLGISTERAYDSVKAGEIPVLRFGRRVRIPKHALRQLLETGTWDGRQTG